MIDLEGLEKLRAEAQLTEPLCVNYTELGAEDNRRLYAFLMEGDAEDGVIVCVDEEPVGRDVPSPRLELIAAAVNALPELIAMARRVETVEGSHTIIAKELASARLTIETLTAALERIANPLLGVTVTDYRAEARAALKEKPQ